jgi:hypothetical protein
MLSYTGSRNLYGSLTKNTNTVNLTLGDTFINSEIRALLGKHPWPFLKKTRTASTTASTQYVTVPAGFRRIDTVTVTVGTTVYSPKLSPSREHWNRINYSSTTSNTPQWYYIIDGLCYFYPTPASSSNTVTFTGIKNFKDLSIADYTTGSIVSVANGGTAVVGTGTTWTAAMTGRLIRITDSDTTNKGDGEWYEIASVGSTTSLTLAKPYLGTAISAGTAAYTIGQMSPIPDGYQEIPVYRAAARYWAKEDKAKSALFKADALELEKQMFTEYGSPTTSMVIEDTSAPLQNPNLFISA